MFLDRTIGSLAFVLGTGLAPVSSAQAVRISDELARGNLYRGSAALSADGRHAVLAGRYLPAYNVNTVYSVTTDGSAPPVMLYDESGFPDPEVEREFDPGTVTFLSVTPNSEQVLFTVDERGTLYAVPVDGSALFRALAPADTDIPFLLAPDGSRAVFTRRELGPSGALERALYSVRTDGSESAVRLVPARDGARVLDAEIDAHSRRVVFTRGGEDAATRRVLFSVPIDGSEPPVRLSPAPRIRAWSGVPPDGAPSGPGANVTSFAVSPGGAHVLMLLEDAHAVDLLVVPIEGTEPARRLARGDVRLAMFSGGSDRVVYRATAAEGGPAALFSQALDGSDLVLLHEPADGVERLEALQSAVLFVDVPLGAGECLFTVPLAGGAPPRALGARLEVGRRVREFRSSPDRTRVVYSADEAAENVFTLFAAELAPPGPLSGSRPEPTALPTVNGAADVERFVFTSDSSSVLAHVADPEGLALERVPVNGDPARRLSGPEGASDLFVDEAGTLAVYRGTREHDTRLHVYGVALDGDEPPAQLDDFGPVHGGIHSYEIHPDGTRALYAAGARDFAFPEPVVVPLDFSGPPRVLEGLVQGAEFLFEQHLEPLTERLVYWVGIPGVTLHASVFSATLDGSEPRVLLGEEVLQFGLAGDRALLVTRIGSAASLRTVPVDGADAGVVLNGAPLAPLIDGRKYDFAVSPGADRVVFTTWTMTSGEELHSAPADGSLPAVRLHPTPVAGGAVVRASARFTADGTRVAFLGDLTRNGGAGLWVAPLDGATPAIELWSPPAAREALTFALTPDSQRAVFAADLEMSGRHRMYVVPLDGSTTPVPLARAPGDPEVLDSLRIDPSGTRAVFLSRNSRVVSVPVDGSPGAVILNPSLAGRVLTIDLQVSDDWVVYEADHDLTNRFDLFAVPIDGSAPPHRVNEPVASDRRSQRFQIVGDEVLFLSPVLPAPYPYPSALFRAALSGATPPENLNPSGVFSAFSHPMEAFLVSPDGTRVLFPAFSDSQGLYEAALDP